MPRHLTRKEWLAAIAKPKRRFQVLTLGASRTVRLGQPVSAPSYWFKRNELGEMEGRYIRDPDMATIYLNVDEDLGALLTP